MIGTVITPGQSSPPVITPSPPPVIGPVPAPFGRAPFVTAPFRTVAVFGTVGTFVGQPPRSGQSPYSGHDGRRIRDSWSPYSMAIFVGQSRGPLEPGTLGGPVDLLTGTAVGPAWSGSTLAR